MAGTARLAGKRAIVTGSGIATRCMADLYGGDWLGAEREWGAAMHARGRNGRVEEIAAGAVWQERWRA